LITVKQLTINSKEGQNSSRIRNHETANMEGIAVGRSAAIESRNKFNKSDG